MVKRSTTLTFYGGVDEIGGNKILLQDRDTRIFLDFGMSFGMKKRFYSPPFLSPKSEKSLQDLGVLPRLDGIYRFDKTVPRVNALFVSHAHMDHSAYLSFIKRQIRVHCGETTRMILQASSETRRTDLEFDLEGIAFETFRTGQKVAIDGLQVEPIHVDHSVPGAYGFVIYTSGGAVVYTGDLRHHGPRSDMTDDFVCKAKKADPVVAITEATNMTGATVSSESEVKNKLDVIVGQSRGVVLAEYAYADVDRLNSFYHAAKENGRCLAVSLKQAHLLERLRQDKRLRIPSLDDENVWIFRRSKKTSEKWEKQLIEQYSSKVFDVFEASKRQCKMILAMSFYDLEELVHLRPEAGSCYVSSTSEPFNEEMELDYERLINWLSHYGLPYYHVHVSGHIMPLQLKSLLKEINASKTFPIHTEHASLLAKFCRDLKGNMIVPEKCKEYSV